MDPTLPLGAAIAYCAYRLFDKRKKRNPDGPFMGGTPVWGALLATLATLVISGVVRCKLLGHCVVAGHLGTMIIMLQSSCCDDHRIVMPAA